MHKDLKKIRKKIDKIDKRLQKQLEKREKLIQEVKELKEKHDLPVHDQTREKAILESINNPFTKKIFKEILKYSKDLQSRL